MRADPARAAFMQRDRGFGNARQAGQGNMAAAVEQQMLIDFVADRVGVMLGDKLGEGPAPDALLRGPGAAPAQGRQEDQQHAEDQESQGHRALIHESHAVRQVHRAGEIVLHHAA